MTSTIANALVFAVFFTAIARARLISVALAPSCALILARTAGLVDISSASHPLRWIVPLTCAGTAGIAVWWYGQKRFYDVVVGELRWQSGAHVASLLILASCGPDLLALHPFFWERFETWALTPLQIALCVTILVVLWAPERWVEKWIA